MSCLIVNMKEDGIHRQDENRKHRLISGGSRDTRSPGRPSPRTLQVLLTSAFMVHYHSLPARALFIKGILKDSHSYLWAQDLVPGPFQWCSCFRAPRAQDCGCVSVFVGLVPSSSPSSFSPNLMIKSLFSFTVCLPSFTGSF